MPLSQQHLSFIVDFIAACRRVDDDAGLDALLARLRAEVGSPLLWAGACGGDLSRTITAVGESAGGADPQEAINGCRPARNAIPEATANGVRSCQSDATGGSACLFVDALPGARERELLAHVVPHLLDAVSRVVVRSTPAERPALTAREEEVLRWLAEGKSNWVIGQILGISEGTVKYHLGNLFTKLGVSTRTQAAAMAMSRLAQGGFQESGPAGPG